MSKETWEEGEKEEGDFNFVFVFSHPTLFLTGNIFNFPLVKSIHSCE